MNKQSIPNEILLSEVCLNVLIVCSKRVVAPCYSGNFSDRTVISVVETFSSCFRNSFSFISKALTAPNLPEMCFC